MISVALIGNPNVGKSALFNALTGLHAKVANHPGITVDVKKGFLRNCDNKYEIRDLPGTYSLCPQSEDEALTLSYIKNPADLFVFVADTNHLDQNLYLLAELKKLDLPIVVALTFMDQQENSIDCEVLSTRLELPVVGVSSKNKTGIDALIAEIYTHSAEKKPRKLIFEYSKTSIDDAYAQVDGWLAGIYHPTNKWREISDKIDKFALHPIVGPALLFAIFFILVSALFSWSEPLIGLVESLNTQIARIVESVLPSGTLFSSLMVHGVIEGVGSVLVFLPLIGILFLFLGLLEDSGYMARATFLLDQLLSKIGLPSKSFAPLVSGFACAVPAIMATRNIESKRDRIVTILVAPFMTCSARLPVYALLIALVFSGMPPLLGFIPVGPIILFFLYALGVVTTLLAALVFRKTLFSGPISPLVLELPPYRIPQAKPLFSMILDRSKTFLKEAGSIILAITILIWALFTFPQQSIQPNLTQAEQASYQMENSYAGSIGKAIEPIIEPLGFDWKIGISLLASFAAREVFVSTMGVIYGLGGDADENSQSLRNALLNDINRNRGTSTYTPLVALTLMIFFALAMQCMSTLAITKKETKTWRWPVLQFSYMTILAYVCSFSFFQIGQLLGF